MKKAIKIKMKNGCGSSNSTLEIAEIYVEGFVKPGFFKKEDLHDYLNTNPRTIKVDIYPYPDLVPATSSRGEKYVRSEPNDTPYDNLLKLPRS